MEKQSFSTEEVLQEDIRTVTDMCLRNQMIHLSRCFTGDPDHFAVVTASVTCPDTVAAELHALLDATVRAFMTEHDFAYDGPANIQ
jgi:hypothetical protein